VSPLALRSALWRVPTGRSQRKRGYAVLQVVPEPSGVSYHRDNQER
jgi:hypothetical protein